MEGRERDGRAKEEVSEEAKKEEEVVEALT